MATDTAGEQKTGLWLKGYWAKSLGANLAVNGKEKLPCSGLTLVFSVSSRAAALGIAGHSLGSDAQRFGNVVKQLVRNFFIDSPGPPG